MVASRGGSIHQCCFQVDISALGGQCVSLFGPCSGVGREMLRNFPLGIFVIEHQSHANHDRVSVDRPVCDYGLMDGHGILSTVYCCTALRAWTGCTGTEKNPIAPITVWSVYVQRVLVTSPLSRHHTSEEPRA